MIIPNNVYFAPESNLGYNNEQDMYESIMYDAIIDKGELIYYVPCNAPVVDVVLNDTSISNFSYTASHRIPVILNTAVDDSGDTVTKWGIQFTQVNSAIFSVKMYNLLGVKPLPTANDIIYSAVSNTIWQITAVTHRLDNQAFSRNILFECSLNVYSPDGSYFNTGIEQLDSQYSDYIAGNFLGTVNNNTNVPNVDSLRTAVIVTTANPFENY